MTATDPLFAVTDELVRSTDRLLGLIDLTAHEITSLEERDMVGGIIEQAMRLVDADGATASGAFDGRWGRSASAHEWSTSRAVDAPLTVTFVRDSMPFTTADMKLLEAATNLATNALRMARMHATALDQALMAREHETAAELTTTALPSPDAPPSVDGADIWVLSQPARTTGGDLFTWAEIDGSLWFAVGDVSGKGLPAAVLMSLLVNALDQAFAEHGNSDPIAVSRAVDRWMFRRLSEASMFATLLIGHYRPDDRVLRICNHGHSPALLQRGSTVRRIHASSPPVGVLEGLMPEQEQIEIAPRDLIAIGSDGITEQTSPTGELFGEDTFDSLIASMGPDPSAREVGGEVMQTVDRHQGRSLQTDDRTLLLVRFER